MTVCPCSCLSHGLKPNPDLALWGTIPMPPSRTAATKCQMRIQTRQTCGRRYSRILVVIIGLQQQTSRHGSKLNQVETGSDQSKAGWPEFRLSRVPPSSSAASNLVLLSLPAPLLLLCSAPSLTRRVSCLWYRMLSPVSPVRLPSSLLARYPAYRILGYKLQSPRSFSSAIISGLVESGSRGRGCGEGRTDGVA